MIPYVIVTIISTFFAYFAYKTPIDIRKKKVLTIFSMLTLCLLAAARDITVGTDTSVYGESLFEWIHNHNFNQTIAMNQNADIEIGYIVIIFLLSRITGNVFWAYFLMEFICVFFVYKALDDASTSKYKWMGVFLYNVLFYSFSLNLMRQSMAMSIVLFGFKYVRVNRFWRYLLVVLIAFLVHRTAIIGLFIYPLFMICGYKGEWCFKSFFNKYRSLFIVTVIGLSFVIVFFAKQWIVTLSFLRETYSFHVQNINSYNPSIAMIVLMFAFVIPFFVLKVWHKKEGQKLSFYMLLVIMCTILWQLQGISSEIYRVTFYFWILILVMIPELLESICSKNNKFVFSAYYILLGTIYYWYVFVQLQTNETYPYTSILLGIG